MVQQEEMVHSKVGASSAKRWINCPGSVSLCAQVPKKETSKYAAEGTVAHQIAEQMLRFGIPAVLPKDNGQLGRVIEQDGYEIAITVPMIEAATTYAETIYADFIEQGLVDPQLVGQKMHFQRVDCMAYMNIEKGFCLASIDKELFGTNDASIAVPFGKLTVYDFKYGAGVAVDVEDNEQMMFYALGIAEELGGVYCFSEIELVIIQPRAMHRDGPIRRWSTTPERLEEFGKLLKAKLIEVRSPGAPVNSGTWCKFCDAKTICNCVRNEVNKVAQMEFAPIDYDAALAVRYAAAAPPNILDLTPEEIANVLDKATMVRDWITAVENRALELLKTGQDIPGFKVVAKKANRAWSNEDSVRETFEGIYGDAIYTEKKILSPAQLEKIVGKASVKDLVVIPDAGYTVAHVGDKRPAVIPATQDFDEVQPELDL